jgi:hypothetical protein
MTLIVPVSTTVFLLFSRYFTNTIDHIYRPYSTRHLSFCHLRTTRYTIAQNMQESKIYYL